MRVGAVNWERLAVAGLSNTMRTWKFRAWRQLARSHAWAWVSSQRLRAAGGGEARSLGHSVGQGGRGPVRRCGRDGYARIRGQNGFSWGLACQHHGMPRKIERNELGWLSSFWITMVLRYQICTSGIVPAISVQSRVLAALLARFVACVLVSQEALSLARTDVMLWEEGDVQEQRPILHAPPAMIALYVSFKAALARSQVRLEGKSRNNGADEKMEICAAHRSIEA